MPEHELLPSDWSQKIKGFSFLLLIKVIRPDRLLFAVNNYVKRTLGDKFFKTINYDLNKIIKNLASKTPLLLILSPNYDPWQYLDIIARNNQKQIIQLSLGQGQL